MKSGIFGMTFISRRGVEKSVRLTPLWSRTGSPRRPERAPGGGYYTNSVLIGYFPAEEPRYAMAVVLEYGGGGANAAPVLRQTVRALYGS